MKRRAADARHAESSSATKAIDAVKAAYAELAARPAVRNCIGRAECCQFRLTGRVPMLTQGEALVLAQGWRATGRKNLPRPADGACPLLCPETRRCLVYASRPFGCRTHFCRAAGGGIPRGDVLDLIRELERIDETLGGDGPHDLGYALERALAAWQTPTRVERTRRMPDKPSQ